MTRRQAKKVFAGSRARAERGVHTRWSTWEEAFRVWQRCWWRRMKWGQRRGER